MNALITHLRQRKTSELLLMGIAATSVGSLMMNILGGAQLVVWMGAWLLDFSTDLAGGAVLVIILRVLLERPPEEPATTTYFIEAEEIPHPPTPTPDTPVPETPPAEPEIAPETLRKERVLAIVDALKGAISPEARQTILDKMMLETPNLLQEAELIAFDLRNCNLAGADLSRANLTKANLRGAQLQNTQLCFINFQMAQLIEADLHSANLNDAQLYRAFLSGASLMNATLVRADVRTSFWGVNLVNADLREADLREAEFFRADLRGANLTGANIAQAKVSHDTLLPDGTYMGRNTDLRRFVDANHPLYWRSADPSSPAYSSKKRRMES